MKLFLASLPLHILFQTFLPFEVNNWEWWFLTTLFGFLLYTYAKTYDKEKQTEEVET